VTTTTYSGACSTTTDPALKARETCSDAFGRLIQVLEDPAGLNYETDYTYDVLNNLLTINQKGGSNHSALWRARTFAYDGLSRLTSATNPESGTVTYTYDGNGNLSTKTSPAPNQSGSATVITTYTYDPLNRLSKKSFSDGTTPTVQYGYDAVALTGCTTTPPSLTDANPLNYRTAMCDGAGAESWNHDPMGRILTDSRITNGTNWPVSFTYNLDGSTASIVYPPTSWPETLTITPGGAGRPLSESGGFGMYAHNGHYAPNGAACYYIAEWGGSTHISLFNSRFEPTRIYSADINAPAASNTNPCPSPTQNGNLVDLSYNYVDTNGHNNGNVAAITNNVVTARSQNFTYDSLNRLSTAQTSSTYSTDTANCWAETYSYDPWGNLYKLGANTATQSAYVGCSQESGFDYSNFISGKNQITYTGFAYDAAGNIMTPPGAGAVTYNAENQLVSAGGVTYEYDGDGNRVYKSNGTLYWYGSTGAPLAESDFSGNLIHRYYFFNGIRVARWEWDFDNGQGLNQVSTYSYDALGNTRLLHGFNGQWDISEYYPFGGERLIQAVSPNTQYKFTGKERDSESGLDNLVARYYSSSLGRFMRPDPDNAGAATRVPQSWNAYSYVLNNPMNATDPTGLWCVWEDVSHDDRPEDGGFTEEQCDKEGGHWDPTDTITGMDAEGNISQELLVLGEITDNDRIIIVSQGVNNLTTVSSLSDVGVNGLMWAGAVEGAAELPGAARGGWQVIASWRMASTESRII
jgi:RHS repeat-associated protein